MAAATFAVLLTFSSAALAQLDAGSGPTGRGVAAAGCGITEASRRTGGTRGVLP